MPRRLIQLAAVLAAALALGGCYENTVSTSGFGADGKTIHEPSVGQSERVLGYPKSSYKPLPTTH